MTHAAENDARCPGCGSVVSDHFQSCRPTDVDVTVPGFRYLAGTWGYCLHLGRHIKTGEPTWLETRLIDFAEWRGDSREDAEWAAETYLRETSPIPPAADQGDTDV